MFDEGGGITAEAVGNKGLGLRTLVQLGMPVPTGFTITVKAGKRLLAGDSSKLFDQINTRIRKMESLTRRRFGASRKPLLLSVRSGAAVSMPGMMDTILNVGLTRRLLTREFGGNRTETYERFLALLLDFIERSQLRQSDKADRKTLEKILSRKSSLSTGDYKTCLNDLCWKLLERYDEATGLPFPDDPHGQLCIAINSVLESWTSDRANAYRNEQGISHKLGTGVTIQAMVDGTLDEQSGTGVVFSRDPITGARIMYGEYLRGAAGSALVSGTKTPDPISSLQETQPALYDELAGYLTQLDEYFRHPVDVEFTVESGTLYLLQVRHAKLTPVVRAAMLVEDVQKRRIRKADALQQISADGSLFKGTLTFETPDSSRAGMCRLEGIPASPGAAFGRIVTRSIDALRAANDGIKPILCLESTSPDDLEGMLVCAGIVTKVGGAMSHAAVVARSLGIPAVVGVHDMQIYYERGGVAFPCGRATELTIDGSTGKIYHDTLKLVLSPLTPAMLTIQKWIDEGQPKRHVDYHEFTATTMNLNKAVVDFYLLNGLMRELRKRNGAIPAAVREHFGNHVRMMVRRLLCYIVVAVAGELRHKWDSSADSRSVEKAYRRIIKVYGIKASRGPRGQTQEEVINRLSKMPAAATVDFLSAAEIIFRNGTWGGSCGGAPWAKIAKAGLWYLTGRVPDVVFVDHVIDLKHNGGTAFDKRESMLRFDDDQLRYELDEKKKAKTFDALYRSLVTKHYYDHRAASDAVLGLIKKNRVLKSKAESTAA